MVPDESAIRLDCKRLGKTYYFCTWTPQKTLSTRNRADPIRFRSLGSVFGPCWVSFGSCFVKMLLPAYTGSTILQNGFKRFRPNKSTFSPSEWQRNDPKMWQCGSKVTQKRPKAIRMCQKCPQHVPNILRRNEHFPFEAACNRVLNEF